MGLKKDHVIIDYRAVELSKRNTRFWSPQTADLYLDFLGQHWHQRHSISDFELFSVDGRKTLALRGTVGLANLWSSAPRMVRKCCGVAMFSRHHILHVLVPLLNSSLFLSTATKAQQVHFETHPAATIAGWELAVPGKAAREIDRGNEAMTRGKWRKAIAHFQAAIAAYSQYAVAYNNLGIAYVNAGQADKAEAAFDRAIRLNERLSMAYVNKARLLQSQGRLADAEPLLTKVLSYDPRYGEALLLLSFVEFRRGKYDEAVGHGNDALKVDAAQYSLAHYVLAMALQAKSDFGNAAAEYRAFLKQSPDSPYAARARARLNALLQDAP